MPRRQPSERRLARTRLDLFLAANADERSRFNAAIAAGATALLTTHAGTYAVGWVDSEWWYHTPAANGGFGSSWAGCNDGTWTDLLRQAGVARHRFNQLAPHEQDREVRLAAGWTKTEVA
jgi:hypothetical protein